jgi:hypothetical protein
LTIRPARCVIIGRTRYLVSVIGEVTLRRTSSSILLSARVESTPAVPMPALFTSPWIAP